MNSEQLHTQDLRSADGLHLRLGQRLLAQPGPSLMTILKPEQPLPIPRRLGHEP